MFNTFNNTNNVNPLSSPQLFDFNGFLRVGVGDPRQAQLSVRLRVLSDCGAAESPNPRAPRRIRRHASSAAARLPIQISWPASVEVA